MLFISVDDFFTQVSAIPRISREEEKALARRMADGDEAAREALIRGYLFLAAAHVRRTAPQIQTLQTVYACVAAVEQGVDRFHFLQDSETFVHHLSWRLRQCITRCIADQL